MKVGYHHKYTITRGIFHRCGVLNRKLFGREELEKEKTFCALYHKESKIHFADIKYNWEFPIKVVGARAY